MLREEFYWYDERTDEVKVAFTTEAYMDQSDVFWSREMLDVKNYRTNIKDPELEDRISYEEQCDLHACGMLDMDREGA